MAPSETESSYRGKTKSLPSGTIMSVGLSGTASPCQAMDSRRELHGSADEEQQCSAEHDGQRCPEEAVDSGLEDLDVRIARDLFERAANVQKQKVASSPVRPVCWSGAQGSLRFLRRLNRSGRDSRA